MNSGKNILAVCDLEAAYACNFVEYVHRKNSMPFDIQAFTGLDSLKKFAEKQKIEILLISDKAMCEEIKTLDIGQIVILSEGVHHPMLDCYPSVYKYQSSDAVIREVMNCYGAKEKLCFQKTGNRQKKERIGIYSPVGRTAKTSFALTLGQILAKEKPVLYLNLEEYAGFEQLLDCSYERNLGDLIYFIRQDYNNLPLKISGMVRSVNNLDYLPPALSPMDVQNTKLGEWIQLLEEIENNMPYETIILDFGDGVSELYAFLNQCHRVYMPVRGDVMSTAKLQQFEHLLQMWNYDSLLERIEKVKLPYHRTEKRGREYLDELVWSQLGDFVRELVRKEKNH
ncbi:MAG: hypothetical protein ACOX8E_01120 [Ruminococcus sp.]|jgi:cellulose biosynthesis protein BcsQ